MNATTTRRILIGLAAAAVAACGGAGPQQVAGIDRTGISATGAITGFGSVIVGGTHFQVNGDTQIVVNGASGATQDDLAVGQVVTIQGSVDANGNTLAQQIVYNPDLRGPVQSIDRPSMSFAILGKTVLVSDSTLFDGSIQPASFDGLSVGQSLEVTGFIDGEGRVHATRVEADMHTGVEIRGKISSVDASLYRLSLGELTVDYSQATLSGFPAGAGNPATGDFVEVEGSFDGSVLTATKLELEQERLRGEDGEEGHLEGVITRFGSAEDFDVGGTTVHTTTATEFEHGSASDLGLGVAVEVEGSFDAGGALTAHQVSLRLASQSRVASTIESIDPGSGTFRLMGITLQTDADTRYQDDSATALTFFGFGDLAVGDFVQVGGVEDLVADAVNATLVVRRDSGAAELRGSVQTVDAQTGSFAILGVTVVTTANTQFGDLEDNAVSGTDFYSLIQAGTRLRVDGQWDAGSGILTATQIEIDDH